ncbi:MAG: tail fiber domain-containing protein [Sphingopyxis sp.]|uniref:tail fiber domain-containing protein n=1 Tax=Sphingopyxis sp. TaxID=1908224 RepID=UPI003D6CA9BE
MPTIFFADLVRETSAGTGSGALVLGGAVAGHRRFADVVPEGANFHYSIAGVRHAGEWEVGTGSIDGEGRLSRDVVAASSNGGTHVGFSAGVKTVALTVGAAWYAGQEAADAELAEQAAGLLAAEAEIAAQAAAIAAAQAGIASQAAGLTAVAATVAAHGTAIGGNAAAIGAAQSAIAAHDTAIAGKQPISTGHGAATSVEASDSFTVRRASGWVNVPASALVHQRSGGGFVCAGPLGVGEEAPGQRLVVKASSAADGSAPVVVEIADTQAGTAGWTANAAFAALNFRSADGSVSGAGVRAQIAATMPATHGGQTDLKFSVSNAALLDKSAVLDTAGRFRPGADNVQTLGMSGFRWSTVYAATGTINTSDAREKSWQGPAHAAELRAARRILAELGFFQWHDAIAAKGADGARRHFGVRAQTVWAIMADEGLVDPIDGDGRPGHTPYAFLCFDRWEDAAGASHDRFGVRGDQLALFLVAGLAAELAA